MIRPVSKYAFQLSLASACLVAGLSACTYGPTTMPPYRQLEQQPGIYVRPAYLNPEPTPMIPPVDACRSQLYQGLLGQHEGAIYIAGLPGRKRVLKPAEVEYRNEADADPYSVFAEDPYRVEVREYLADQVLYAPAIRTVTERIALGPEQEDRLTIELDREGYVQEIRCS